MTKYTTGKAVTTNTGPNDTSLDEFTWIFDIVYRRTARTVVQ